MICKVPFNPGHSMIPSAAQFFCILISMLFALISILSHEINTITYVPKVLMALQKSHSSTFDVSAPVAYKQQNLMFYHDLKVQESLFLMSHSFSIYCTDSYIC